MSIPLIIPDETELSRDGFFMGQLICPKKSHVARWDIGQICMASRFDLSIGPVLKIKDLISGQIFEELPEYIDFLVFHDFFPEDSVLMHQLVVPASGTVVDWQVGRIVGFLDSNNGADINLDTVLVADVQNDKRYQVNLSQLNFLIQQETDFSEL